MSNLSLSSLKSSDFYLSSLSLFVSHPSSHFSLSKILHTSIEPATHNHLSLLKPIISHLQETTKSSLRRWWGVVGGEHDGGRWWKTVVGGGLVGKRWLGGSCGEKGGGFDVVEVVVVLFFWCVSSKVFLGFGYFSHFVHPWLLEFFSLGTALMSGGGLFLQTQNHPLKGYFVLLRWMLPPPEPGPVDHCKPPSEPALPEKSGGPGGLGMLFDFFFVGFLLIFGYVLDFFDGFCVLLGWLMLMGASVGLLLLIFLWVL
ncbi:hypothetical protein HanOQP8_Chr13g0468001 [Helianthus annuus]|nr:hypothetical protein HanOQP8_Chr13g0468001 [Helianthus annuus]